VHVHFDSPQWLPLCTFYKVKGLRVDPLERFIETLSPVADRLQFHPLLPERLPELHWQDLSAAFCS